MSLCAALVVGTAGPVLGAIQVTGQFVGVSAFGSDGPGNSFFSDVAPVPDRALAIGSSEGCAWCGRSTVSTAYTAGSISASVGLVLTPGDEPVIGTGGNASATITFFVNEPTPVLVRFTTSVGFSQPAVSDVDMRLVSVTTGQQIDAGGGFDPVVLPTGQYQLQLLNNSNNGSPATGFEPFSRTITASIQVVTTGGTCDSIDFNNNGVFPEDQDVIDFFTVLAGGVPATCDGVLGCGDIDFNNNEVFPEDQDVIDFFAVLAGETCS